MNACDAELTCVNWSGQNVMNPVTTCTRLCMGNADCAGSAYPGATCSEPILTDGSGICVGGVVTEEGGVANLAGNPATACAADLTGARSILFGLADGEQSCVRPCNNDGECTGTAGFCDIDPTITATDTPAGTCMTRLRGPGSICSDRDGTAGCSNDTQTMGLLVCFAPPIGYPDGTLPANSGVCLGVCGNNLQGIPNNCVTPHDPTLNPTCLTGGVIFTNPDLGICDDRCSAFPDRCTGPGWDNGNGQDCVQLALNMGGSGDFDEPDITYCIDRIPPFLDVWDSASMMLPSPQQNCATSPFSCPDGTNCFGVDANTAGCVYGCSATATVSGCEQSTTGTTCNSLADLNVIMSADESGLCQSVGF